MRYDRYCPLLLICLVVVQSSISSPTQVEQFRPRPLTDVKGLNLNKFNSIQFFLCAAESGKSSKATAYRTPGGDFLLDQPEDLNHIQDFHGPPPHFEELRSIHKIKDRTKREAILEERTNRNTRSPNPEFQGRVGARIEKDKNNENSAAGLTLPSVDLGTEHTPENIVAATTQIPRNECRTTGSSSKDDQQVRVGELLLPSNYELLQIPKPDYGKSIGKFLPGPLICLLLIRILGISELNEIEGSITFDVDLTVEWIDGAIFDVSEQLGHPPPTAKQVLQAQRTLSPVFLKKLWRPDIFMDDLVKVDQPTITNKAVLSFKFNSLTGFISYTVRMTITANCPMYFEYFPADTQRCLFRFASYSHTKDDMSLDWLELDSKHIGIILEDDSEDNFDIQVDKIDKYEYTPKWNNAANDSFEVLTFSIAARRKISYHLIQTYLPSVFNIFVTWLVFLIPYTLYDCRIGTTMTTLLTLTAMFSAVREQSPQVNYVKAIDIWMLACVLFIFLNLVELSLMTWMRITIETFEEMAEKAEDVETGKDPEKNAKLDLDEKVTPWKIQKFRKVYAYFSRFSFSMFAGLFVIFNIVYWTWLFTASKYFEWVSNGAE